AMVVIDGGTTNRAFLLALADQPQVRAGSYDNRWLDRLTSDGRYLCAQHPVALVAAAIEAAEADQAAAQANFFAGAARGRPALPDEVGHRLRLRLRGNSYPMHVAYLGGDDYQVDTPAGLIDVRRRRLGRYERVVTCQGKRYRVVADAQGLRLLVEVDGLPHIITRDDGGQVRAPSPAFVVAALVSRGDTVRAGDPLVVVECMKMETTITAPYPGTVTAVLAGVNTQVEAGAPLVRLRAPEQEEPGSCGAVIDLSDLASVGPAGSGAAGSGDGGRAGAAPADGLDQLTDARLRAYLLGYDLSDDDARALSRQRGATLADLPLDDPGALRTEQEFLEIFADVAALSRRVPDDAEDDHARSSQEHLFTFLAFVDPERSGAPDKFRTQLRAAVARYGVTTLRRTPELEQALLRVYRSVTRLPAAAPIMIAILDRWRRAGEASAATMTDQRLAVLDRLIDSAQGRHQEVCDLAREVRFQYVDAPLLKASRAWAYAEIGGCVSELSGHPSPERIRELTRRLVWFPL
ncbi:MAG TPA: biotin/lipoyl-containing protein, partial [Streptosporangiaceae bacterium]